MTRFQTVVGTGVSEERKYKDTGAVPAQADLDLRRGVGPAGL